MPFLAPKLEKNKKAVTQSHSHTNLSQIPPGLQVSWLRRKFRLLWFNLATLNCLEHSSALVVRTYEEKSYIVNGAGASFYSPHQSLDSLTLWISAYSMCQISDPKTRVMFKLDIGAHKAGGHVWHVWPQTWFPLWYTWHLEHYWEWSWWLQNGLVKALKLFNCIALWPELHWESTPTPKNGIDMATANRKPTY